MKRPVGRPPKYPFRRLGIGESIFVPGRCRKRIRDAVYQVPAMKFTCRTIVHKGEIGVKVVRLA